MRVELSLPDDVYPRAQRLAQVSHRGIADVLAEAVRARLRHVMAVLVRRAWVAAGWHPPLD